MLDEIALLHEQTGGTVFVEFCETRFMISYLFGRSVVQNKELIQNLMIRKPE
jgi:hypothetical protein